MCTGRVPLAAAEGCVGKSIGKECIFIDGWTDAHGNSNQNVVLYANGEPFFMDQKTEQAIPRAS